MNRSKVSMATELEKEVFLSAKAEKVEMTLNTSNAIASGLLIQRLTELYENPIEATVRETVSNAIDAVTENYTGERPVVSISAPTSLHPVLVIKDNGVGMSYEDLKEVYSKYGSSTKTDNLETIGAYGLGAKSPLAYGTEFTVTSVKDRQKTTIIVAREELTNYIKIVNSEESDEPTGTIVSIPVSSRDIEEFSNYINHYKTTPMDKDIDLMINGIKVETELTVLTDNLKIYEGENETVFGRVWVNSKNPIGLLNVSEYSIDRQIKLVIGGWAYSTPSSRKGYYNTSNMSTIYIELKPGIVSFNSSRDAILQNDRYVDLEELIKGYIFSEDFDNDVIERANELDLEDFKKVLSKLLYDYRRHMKIEGNQISMDKVNFNSKTVNMNKLKHNETGYDLTSLLEFVPSVEKPTVVFKEKKERNYQTSTNSIMLSTSSYYNQFDRASISNINREIEDIMNDNIINDEVKSHSLSLLIVNLASMAAIKEQGHSSEDIKVTFVTDIANEDHIKELKAGRKSLIRIRNGKIDKDDYDSVLIYTKHKKKDMEKMVEDLFSESIDIRVEEVNTIIEEIKTFKSENKVERKVKEKQRGLTTVFRQVLDQSKTANLDSLKEETDKKRFVVITKNKGPKRADMMYYWYCNEHKLDNSEVEMYVSRGVHNIDDLQALKEVFGDEIYRDPDSDNVGISKLYYEEFHNKVAEKHSINNSLVNTSEKAFVRLIAGLYEDYPRQIANILYNKIEYVAVLAAQASIEIDTEPIKRKIEEFKNVDVSIYGDIDYRFHWRLDTSATEHLISLMNEEHINLAKDILSLINYQTFKTTEGKVEKISSRISDYAPGITEVTQVYEDGEFSDSYSKLIKSATESYIAFVVETFNQLLLLNFQ